MSSRLFLLRSLFIVLLLSLGACISREPAPPTAEELAKMQAMEAHNAWLQARDKAIEQLRQNPHLSVHEQPNGDVTVRIRSGNVFRTNSTAISPNIQPIIEHIAATLAAHPQLTVRVVGHTDNVGDPQKNLKLSIVRAQSVRNALVLLGLVDMYWVSYEGRGDTEPLVPNTSAEGRAVNRRVELQILNEPSNTPGTDNGQVRP